MTSRAERLAAALEAEIHHAEQELANRAHVPDDDPEKAHWLAVLSTVGRIKAAAHRNAYATPSRDPVLRTANYDGTPILWRRSDQEAAIRDGWMLDVMTGQVAVMARPLIAAGWTSVSVAEVISRVILPRAREGSGMHMRALIFEGMAIFNAWGEEYRKLKQRGPNGPT